MRQSEALVRVRALLGVRMIADVAFFFVGLVLLYYGAEFLVSAASSMAFSLGITPIVVGCTVVAFGTSAPELVVSLAAVHAENDGVSIGNIIGSNIANLLLILGAASLIRPIEVSKEVVRREYPIMLAALGLLTIFGLDGQISRTDGIILLVAMAGYMIYQFRSAQKAMAAGKSVDLMADLDENEESNTPKNIMFLILGVFGLAIGAKLMVDSAVSVATLYGIPPLLIGISIVAIGTSLPELATSVIAAFKNESDISVGNVVGSNVFNTLLVLGIVATIASLNIGNAVTVDIWIMLGTAAGIWVLMLIMPKITRVHGVLFLGGYVAYMVSLFHR